ncbi:MAG: hypothetical protein IKF91_01255, partial [Bacilli bacterium]|nr:hypothetical protein [Bacilli bacterium]
KMSTDGSEYGYDAGGNHTGNAGILNALNSNTAFTGNNPAGSCNFDSTSLICDADGLHLGAGSNGYVYAYADSTGDTCYISSDSYAYCDG